MVRSGAAGSVMVAALQVSGWHFFMKWCGRLLRIDILSHV